ncbi:MAG: septum formation initiator family protein [Deltaproteobacteria bacterium]|nr:septum formation initiator family protein [Deltaproteobacteria bacterium]MBW2052036.1 septum formation initiator family protein [Deltaproteobacteria bacterium]MBW2141510.1 septum formation initiator family protein [Deltaproteobacteria bacterium]
MSLFTKNRSIFLILVSLTAILALTLIYNNRGYLSLKRLGQERNELEVVNKEYKEQNRLLMMKIDRIKNDLSYIEDEARKKLGLVRPDEQIFKLKNEPEPALSEKSSTNP